MAAVPGRSRRRGALIGGAVAVVFLLIGVGFVAALSLRAAGEPEGSAIERPDDEEGVEDAAVDDVSGGPDQAADDGREDVSLPDAGTERTGDEVGAEGANGEVTLEPDPVDPDLSALRWSRIAHDEAVFGGPNPQNASAVTAWGDGFVAVGSDGVFGETVAAVWTSEDGRAWSRAPHVEGVLGGPGAQWMSSVAVGPRGLIAVGFDETDDDRNAAVWTSQDGRSWSRTPHDEVVMGGPGLQSMASVIMTGSGVLAVGSDSASGELDGAVWASVDGRAWSRVPHDGAVFGGPGQQFMASVTEGGPGFVAVGSDGNYDVGYVAAVWLSSDGQVWSRVPHDDAVFGATASQEMLSVTVGGPGLVAVGSQDGRSFDESSTPAVWTSVDGFKWARVPRGDIETVDGPQSMLGIASGESGLVAVGAAGPFSSSDAVAWTSTDGLQWEGVDLDDTRIDSAGGQSVWSVVAGGSGFVAVGSDRDLGTGAAAVWVAE
jgi:hypothetical protein